MNLAIHACGSNDTYKVYNKEMHQKEIEYNALKDDIVRGIEQKEFKAWLQPKYGKDGTTMVGAEALVRWYKYGTIIAPYVFIPVCEEQGYIQDIDELVLEDVCQLQRKWLDEGMPIVPISVNVSRAYLDKSDILERLLSIVKKYNIDTQYIQFEVTESSLVGNEEKLKKMLQKLHQQGFKVLLDDFGVGYSSIKTIADMDFDVLKIDKSFVDQIGTEKGNNIMKFTVELSKQLNMQVVVEGIEEQKQFSFLSKLECDYYQGYYFSKPICANDFEKLLCK